MQPYLCIYTLEKIEVEKNEICIVMISICVMNVSENSFRFIEKLMGKYRDFLCFSPLHMPYTCLHYQHPSPVWDIVLLVRQNLYIITHKINSVLWVTLCIVYLVCLDTCIWRYPSLYHTENFHYPKSHMSPPIHFPPHCPTAGNNWPFSCLYNLLFQNVIWLNSHST